VGAFGSALDGLFPRALFESRRVDDSVFRAYGCGQTPRLDTRAALRAVGKAWKNAA
jgi:hypothetical protein